MLARGILAPLALGVEMPVSLWNASIYSTVAVLSLWGSMLHALCTMLALLLGFGDSLRRYPMKLHRLTKRYGFFILPRGILSSHHGEGYSTGAETISLFPFNVT